MPTIADLTEAEDKLAFFRTNIVMASFSPQRNNAEIYEMGLADGWLGSPITVVERIGLRNDASAAMPIVRVLNFPNLAGDTFRAYWCPYQANAVRQVTLGNGAAFMFTAKMDGCSFGVGSETPQGERLCMHANQGGDGRAQRAQLTGPNSLLAQDADPKILDSGAYRRRWGEYSEITTQATAFGVRTDAGWQVWSQICVHSQTHIRFVDLIPVAGVPGMG